MEVYNHQDDKLSSKTIYDTIKLPNGGIIQMDQLAYETFQGICRSNYKGEWTVSMDFKGGTLETADKPMPNNVEYR